MGKVDIIEVKPNTNKTYYEVYYKNTGEKETMSKSTYERNEAIWLRSGYTKSKAFFSSTITFIKKWS